MHLLFAAALNLGAVLAQSEITVDAESQLQEIHGFGVSQAFGRATEFRDLIPEPQRQECLDYLFSMETGAGLSMIRNRIGSGGSGDSILPNSPGSPDGTPEYEWDGDDSGQVWFSRQAMSYGVSAIYADAWSAPGFMKTNGDETNGGYLCGVTGAQCDSGDWRQAYANMLAQYIKFYAEENITVTHVGFLNEPDYTTSYSSMRSDGEQAASFIPIMYDTLQSNDLGDVQMTCCDAMGWPTQIDMTQTLVAQGMEEYLSVLTSHMYTGDPDSPLDSVLPAWQTEAADLDSAWCTTWYSNGGLCEGLTWASKIHMGIVDAGLSAYMYWQGAEINQFQAASYLVATDGTTVEPSGRLWAFAMYSRFVRPGAFRLSTSGSAANTAVAAFQNTDGSAAVVFTNTGGDAQSVNIAFSGFSPSSAEAFLTDNDNAVAPHDASVSEGAIVVEIPAHSMVTVRAE